MRRDALQGNVNTGQWLPGSTYAAQASNKELNHRASTSVEASNPNIWSSHGFFIEYETYAPPIRVSLISYTHTQLQPNKFSVPG